MKAISLKQPWAWLMVNGHKDIENRDRRTGYRGTILVHASQASDEGCYAFVRTTFPDIRKIMPTINDLKRGGIVGQFDIVDCVDDYPSDWFFGKFGYVISNARPLPFVKCRGAVTIPFDVPDELLAHAHT